jgi:hypothetical protein
MNEIDFPKTFKIDDIMFGCNDFHHIETNEEFKNGVLNFNTDYMDYIRRIKINMPAHHNIQSISLLVNDQTLHEAKPDPENDNVFHFTPFDSTGIVLSTPIKIQFTCNPKMTIACEINYFTFVTDRRTDDFLVYNKYYGLHKVAGDKKIILLTYYDTVFNAKFIGIDSIGELFDIVRCPYKWKCPIVYKDNNIQKHTHQVITVRANAELFKNDKCLTFEHKQYANRTTFVVPVKLSKDIIGHLLSEYGLISDIAL